MKLRHLGVALIIVGAIVAYQKADALEALDKKTHVRFTTSQDYVTSVDEEVMIEESFNVDEGDVLLARLEHSDLEVRRGSGDRGSVVVTLEASNMDKGREFFDRLNFEVDNGQRGLSVTTNRQRRNNWNWSSNGKIEIRTVITVPERYGLDVEVSHGNVDLEDGTGSLELLLSHGNLEAGSFSGDEISLKISHGDTRAGNLVADRVDIDASHGDVEVRAIEAEDIRAHLSHGDLEIESASGNISADNSHGDIDIVIARNGGARMRNSHGDIRITTDAGSDVDFDGDSVKISSGVDFEGTVKNERAEGRIAGGGALLSARTSHGRISLQKR